MVDPDLIERVKRILKAASANGAADHMVIRYYTEGGRAVFIPTTPSSKLRPQEDPLPAPRPMNIPPLPLI